jgi:hypothetical protein
LRNHAFGGTITKDIEPNTVLGIGTVEVGRTWVHLASPDIKQNPEQHISPEGSRVPGNKI